MKNVIWPMGVPPPIATTPIEQDLGEIIATIHKYPDGRAFMIRSAAYSYRMSPEAVEAKAHAMKSGSVVKPPPEKAPSYGQMSDQEFAAEKKKLGV
jgi:hypothetical protein